MATLFTKIIRGEIPSYTVYEDDHFKAFLDIRPIHPGHLLIVPKIEVDEFQDLPAPYAERIFPLSQKIAKALKKVTGALRIGTAYIGFEVPHCHCHLVPLWGPMDLDFRKAKALSAAEMEEMQKQLTAELKAFLSV